MFRREGALRKKVLAHFYGADWKAQLKARKKKNRRMRKLSRPLVKRRLLMLVRKESFTQ